MTSAIIKFISNSLLLTLFTCQNIENLNEMEYGLTKDGWQSLLY